MMGRMGGALVAATVAVVAAMTGGAVTGALAQDAAAGFPNKPIRVIVPYPPGDAADMNNSVAAAALAARRFAMSASTCDVSR